MNAIVMTEQYWANSQLSIVRYTGHIYVDGHKYVIVNKDGKDVFELSAKAKPGQKRSLRPWTRATFAGLILFRFTGNWAGNDSWNSLNKTRTCSRSNRQKNG